jgi:hypothetical protein
MTSKRKNAVRGIEVDSLWKTRKCVLRRRRDGGQTPTRDESVKPQAASGVDSSFHFLEPSVDFKRHLDRRNSGDVSGMEGKQCRDRGIRGSVGFKMDGQVERFHHGFCIKHHQR